jgi:O-succinylbenzoic acid--CoA ligase
MSEPLSIFAAARDASDAPGLRIGARVLSLRELATLTQERIAALRHEATAAAPFPVVGRNTIDVVVTLYALLELHVPALLVHPRLTAPERAELEALAARAGPPPPDAAAILFTSGTTGLPRAAVLTRAGLVASARASAANLQWRDDDCWLLCMPIARVGGLSILTRCLAARRCVALAPAFDAGAFPEWIDAQRVTLASMVPTMLTRVLNRDPKWIAPPHLRALVIGGAAASPKLLQRAAERRLPIIVTYGATETCSQVTATPYAGRFATADWGAGVALPGIDVRVTGGHIEVRGPVVMAGYWNQPPLPPGTWFDTGDLGAIDARGCLHLHARRADLIVTGGENAYPAEIERALETFPGIAAAGVFGVPDEVWGHTVAAALVAVAAPPSDAALLDHLVKKLAPHKRPRHICYVDRLPHTPAGKLDRLALPGFTRSLRPLSRGEDLGS